jgi:hypothetical protein
MTSLTSEGAGVVSVGGGLVYLTDFIDEGIVHVLSSATGAEVTTLTHPGGFFTSQPVVVDGSVYLLGYLDNTFAGFLDAWAL